MESSKKSNKKLFMTNSILIKNALIVTINPTMDVLRGDILIRGKRIERIAATISEKTDQLFDAQDYIVTPGFVQTHVHLCQVLFRNLADDLSLLDWLTKKIWPFESKHTLQSIALSAQLGIAELFRSGTTTIMDMGTVQHQDAIFEVLAKSGMRACAGKTMMDYGDRPEGLQETTKQSIDESVRLLKKWHGYDDGRLQYAFAPRFALSCSEELLTEVGKLAKEYQVIYHTHASENINESDMVRKRFGVSNIQLFDKLQATNNLCLAHCVWIDRTDKELLHEKKINVLHCPSANLKLGSGIAPIPDYLKMGINVSLGADGAPCNNNLNMFQEMRLAALIQKPLAGPQAMPAETVLKMATLNGAAALRMDTQIGSLEAGKRADLTFIKNNQVHSIPFDNIYSKLVYSTQASDVEQVMVDGKWVMKNRKLITIDEQTLIRSVAPMLAKIA